MPEQELVTRLRIRANIRRQIATRKSVQEGAPDRIADLLEEAAAALEKKSERKVTSWLTSIPLDEQNRMIRVGAGKHDGRWFFRIDLWWRGYRFT